MVVLRLKRKGRKKRPIYHVVAADKRRAAQGRIIEDLGRFDNLNVPNKLELNEDRVIHWLQKGAEPSDTVRSILKNEGILYKMHLLRWGKSDEEIEEALAEWREKRGEQVEEEQSQKDKQKALLEAEEKEYKKQLEKKAAEEARRREQAEAEAKLEAEKKAKEEAEAKAAEESEEEEAEAKAEAEGSDEAEAESKDEEKAEAEDKSDDSSDDEEEEKKES